MRTSLIRAAGDEGDFPGRTKHEWWHATVSDARYRLVTKSGVSSSAIEYRQVPSVDPISPRNTPRNARHGWFSLSRSASG